MVRVYFQIRTCGQRAWDPYQRHNTASVSEERVCARGRRERETSTGTEGITENTGEREERGEK